MAERCGNLDPGSIACPYLYLAELIPQDYLVCSRSEQ